jgi:hypothetical protein
MGDAPVGAKARVALKLVAGEKEWPLLANLDAEVQPDKSDTNATPANLLTVVKAQFPDAAAGTDAKLVMEATTAAAEHGFTLAVPTLRLCAR